MKIIALLINAFLLPGIGSIMIGRGVSGAFQIAMVVFGVILFIVPFIGPFIGMLLIFIAWIWGLVTVARSTSWSGASITPSANINVNIDKDKG